MTSTLNRALKHIKEHTDGTDKITLHFEKGCYDFHADSAAKKEYYISNHDQTQPKAVVFNLEKWNNLTIEGHGAEFRFHGRLLPFAVVGAKNCTLRGFSIDFADPQIGQAEVVGNDTAQGITIRLAPWTNCRIKDNGILEMWGEGWTNPVQAAIAFEKESRHMVYRTGDLFPETKDAKWVGSRDIRLPHWRNPRLIPGTVLALRSWYRPAPGIFLDECTQSRLDSITVHYAEGMGLLAQRCTDIYLNQFNVSLRGHDDPRYFTTQADATHFSQCKGMIRSELGLYEHMMDDAINIHGVYLSVQKVIDDHTITARYAHGQAWGFGWGDRGDQVQFIRAATMETTGGINRIVEIIPQEKPTIHGTKSFLIRLEHPIDTAIQAGQGFGLENLTWTPEVKFKNNIVRNNRARGALFSSPRHTIVEDNLFDHTAGSAILLCGDCNGWFESGACRDLIIRHNTFINALTNQFQFTHAVISISPEIPQLSPAQAYFHGGSKKAIKITDNTFITFDFPLLYAKSVDGLVFKNNRIETNNDYPPFHPNKQRVALIHCTRTQIQ